MRGFVDSDAVRKALGATLGVAIERAHEDYGWWIYGPGGRAFMGDADVDRCAGDAESFVDRIMDLKPGLPAKYRFRIGRKLRK